MATEEKKTRTVRLEVDLAAKMTGFDSAQRPTVAHHRIMKYYASPLLMGPKASDLLLEMVTHMYTEEEAEIVQHLAPLRPRLVEKAAALAGWSASDAERVLHRLAFVKAVVLAFGQPRKYTLLPIVPGTFEMALMTTDLKTRNSWHRRFAELFERLWETGYTADYPGNIKHPPLRYLPVGRVAPTLQSAWPSDKLEEVLEPFTDFAVGHCQCRVSMQLVGKGCGKPTDNCVGFGKDVSAIVDRGLMRRIDRAEAIAIKREAEKAKCVTWMINGAEPRTGGGSCSCCGCCCHALRVVSEYNVPGMISSPHFMPKRAEAACDNCLACVKVCPMGAWVQTGDTVFLKRERCIGCGLCSVSCTRKALTLEAVPDAVPPDRKLWLNINPYVTWIPTMLGNSIKVYAKRLFE